MGIHREVFLMLAVVASGLATLHPVAAQSCFAPPRCPDADRTG